MKSWRLYVFIALLLLGSKYNQNQLRNSIRLIVRMTIYEKLEVHTCAELFRLRDFQWMWPGGDPPNRYRQTKPQETETSARPPPTSTTPAPRQQPYPRSLYLKQRKWISSWIIFVINGLA